MLRARRGPSTPCVWHYLPAVPNTTTPCEPMSARTTPPREECLVVVSNSSTNFVVLQTSLALHCLAVHILSLDVSHVGSYHMYLSYAFMIISYVLSCVCLITFSVMIIVSNFGTDYLIIFLVPCLFCHIFTHVNFVVVYCHVQWITFLVVVIP